VVSSLYITVTGNELGSMTNVHTLKTTFNNLYRIWSNYNSKMAFKLVHYKYFSNFTQLFRI